MGALVELDRVTFSYGERHDRDVPPPLLRDFSMTVDPHEIVAMVGPSGCGKSTIARLIAGFLFPERGAVLFHGRTVSGPARERGLIAQGDWCLPWFTVRANIRLGLADNLSPSHMNELVRIAGLDHVLDDLPGSLSFGMRQRVCLVRALVAGADLLTLDEPLSSVDAVRKLSLEQSIRTTLKAAGVGGLWITHDLDEALLVSDRLLIVGRRPLSILHEETIEHQSDDTQLVAASPEFQERRFALQRRVLALWPTDGKQPIR